jgi:hypothetical protein
MKTLIALTVSAVIALVLAVPSSAEDGTQSWLNPVTGSGKGRVLIAPTAQEHGEFYAQGEVEVEGVPANTTMAVTRALFSDGSCSTMTKPWAPVAPGLFTTGASGSGNMHFVRDTPNPSGSTFYVEIRVSGGGTLLLSDCIAVFVK